MKNCNPKKSEQVTYALKVTEEQYNNAKKFVEYYANGTSIKYQASLNFKIAMFSIKRKFFTSRKKQNFGYVVYPKAQNKHVSTEEEMANQKKFVCSTFVGYVLYNNVEDVSQFFDERNIKYDYLCVTDIAYIPRVVPLFYSTWDNYMEAVTNFVEEYPEFKQYLNN